MKEFYIYKITRTDNLSYIGSTCHFKRRMDAHRRSERFRIGIKFIVVLDTCGENNVEALEKVYIDFFDTFRFGLNMTETGGGLNKTNKFSTYGMRHTKETRNKMVMAWERKKQRGFVNNMGRKFSTETRKKMSKRRKGICWKRTVKLDRDTQNKIFSEYQRKDTAFPIDFLKTMVKSSQRNAVESLELDQMISPNGKPINYETLYSHYIARNYNVTPQYIRSILKRGANETKHFTEQ